jgi:hypothetical protein
LLSRLFPRFWQVALLEDLALVVVGRDHPYHPL